MANKSTNFDDVLKVTADIEAVKRLEKKVINLNNEIEELEKNKASQLSGADREVAQKTNEFNEYKQKQSDLLERREAIVKEKEILADKKLKEAEIANGIQDQIKIFSDELNNNKALFQKEKNEFYEKKNVIKIALQQFLNLL